MVNKKSQSLAINKIIIIILIVLVIALVIFFIYREDLWNYIKNLPGYTVSKNDTEVDYTFMTPDQLSKYECTPVGNIAYSKSMTSPDYYIYTENTKTNLYVSDSNVLLDIGNSFVNTLGFGEAVIIGTIENNVIKIDSKFLNENSQNYLKYKSLLPTIGWLKILNNAFRLGPNLLCKKEGQVQELKSEAGCVDSCEIHNGLCKETGDENEIAFGKINCKDNQQCFVKINEEKIEDGELMLADFSSIYVNPKIYPPGFVFIGKNSLDVEIGERQIISFSVYYPKMRAGGEAGRNFCYLLRSNDKVLKKGYDKNELNNGEAITSFATFNNNERIFELVVWDSSINSGPKVLKRVEIEPKSNPDFEGLILLFNEKFKEDVLRKSEGKFYAVDAPFKFENGLTISTYRIDKYSDKIEIYGYYSIANNNKNKWYALDCYTGFIGFISVGINFDKIQPSLIETLNENNCKLKY